MFLKTLLVVLTLISFVGFVYSLIFQIENLKKQISKWKWVIIAEIILVIWRGVWYKEIDKEKSLEDLISLMLHTLMILGIKLFFEYKEQIIKKIAELKNTNYFPPPINMTIKTTTKKITEEIIT